MSADPPEDQPRQVTFAPRAWALIIAFGVAALCFFGVAGYVFVDQLRTVRDQNRKQTALLLTQEHALRELLPVLREARRQAPATRDVTRRTRRLLRTSVPLTERLARADLPEIVRDVGQASRAITSGDRLQRSLTLLLSLGEEVRGRSLLERSSVVLGQTRLMLRDLRENRLISRVPRALDGLIRRTDRLLGIQEEALAIQRRLIVTQEEALVRLRRIDERTGGGLQDAITP